MKSVITLSVLITFFCSFLICQNNYSENFNQTSGTVICYNCTNVPIEDCDTLCNGNNCYISLTLPLLTSNIVSYGCTLDFVDSGCINDTLTNDVICYCDSNFCNYPEIVNISETDNSTFYEENETPSSFVASSLDYKTIDNPFLLKNISKREGNETYDNIFQLIETLQFLDDFFDSFDNISIINKTEPDDKLNEDKILQMLNRLDYVLDQKMGNFFKSMENNISSLTNLILQNSNDDNKSREMKTQNIYDTVYGDYENSGSSSRGSFFNRFFKQLSKLYHNYESYKHLKHKNKTYYYINEEKTKIFDLEDSVITYNYDINLFVLEIPDNIYDYKHIIVKRDYPPEDFNLLQSVIAFITSFITSFGEKLGIVAGSVGKQLVDGLEISIQEQLNQTITAANIAFTTYTEVLFSKILAVVTNFIAKTQSRKKRNLIIQFSDEYPFYFQEQYYNFLNIYQKRKREVNESLDGYNLDEQVSLNSTVIPDLAYEILNKTPDYDIMMDNLNYSGKLPTASILADILKPPFSVPSPIIPQPYNIGSFETSGSFSVVTNNNSQSSNMSLTTVANSNNSNIANNNESLSLTTLLPITTTSTKMTTINENTTTTESIKSTIIATTIAAYTTTDVITTTHSHTTVPMDVINITITTTPKITTKKIVTTTLNTITTTTSSPGYLTSIYNYILSFFGYGNSSSSNTTTMVPLPLLSKDQLPNDVIIDNNGQYTFTNGTIISLSQLEEMLKKSGRTLYPMTTQSSGLLYNIISSTTNTIYTFLTAFVNEFNSNFKNSNNASIEKVKDVVEPSDDKVVDVNSTVSPNENLKPTNSPINMLTGLLSVINSYGRKKRSLDDDLNRLLNNILPDTPTTPTDRLNIQKLEIIFKEILSNEDLFHIFIDYITKNGTLSEKEKLQLSRTIFRTIKNIMSNSTFVRMINENLVQYSREDLFEDEYDETYIEKMGQSMKEMGKNIGKIFNIILENILLTTNDYNSIDEKDIEEKMHNDGYQLGIKMGFAIKPILTNFNIVMKKIEKRKKRFIDCVSDSFCFHDVLENDF